MAIGLCASVKSYHTSSSLSKKRGVDDNVIEQTEVLNFIKQGHQIKCSMFAPGPWLAPST